MAFKKYTTCIEPEHYILDFGTHLLGYAQLVLFALSVGFVAFAIITIAAVRSPSSRRWRSWPCGSLSCCGTCTAASSAWGHDDRNCAIIGMVKGHGQSDPSWGEKYGDDDYTMNLWLAPGPLTDAEPEAEYWKEPQGHLVAENQKILNINKHYPDRKYVKFLHCEFEGSGIHDRLNALYGIVATLLLALAIPGFWIVSIILGLLLDLRQRDLRVEGPARLGDSSRCGSESRVARRRRRRRGHRQLDL